MKILFIHHNYPAQFHKLSERLAASPEHEVCFLSLFRRRKDLEAKGVRWVQIQSKHKDLTQLSVHDMSTIFAEGQLQLKAQGFTPDIIHGHANFGTISYSKDIFPTARQTGFFEWLYSEKTENEIHYTSLKPSLAIRMQQRQCNIISLGALDCVDIAISATEWQKKQYPAVYHHKIHTLHNGIDTSFFCPKTPDSMHHLPPSLMHLQGKPVVTFLARSLEPHRGFPIFYASIPHILEAIPEAHIVIAGNEKVSYSLPLPSGESYVHYMQKNSPLDAEHAKRVHFFPLQSYPTYRAMLHLSTVHVHLTVPFTTSWSLLESMACQCTLVASDTPPVQEILQHEKNGILTNFYNAQSLAQSVIFALQHHHELAPLREAARATVLKHYDENITLPKYIQCLLGQK